MLEAELKKYFSEQNVFFTSSGTCAFYLILMAIGKKRGLGEVILPSTICASVGLSVLKAGFKPIYCDVEKDTLCLSARTVKSKITTNTKAVLVAYMFGKTIDLASIEKLANESNFEIIEDIAQSIGGLRGQNYLGAQANYTVVSFNSKKIIGRFASGAVLFKDKSDLQILKAAYEKLPKAAPGFMTDSIAVAFRDLTMGLFNDCRHAGFNLNIKQSEKILESFYDAFFFQQPFTAEMNSAIAGEFRLLDEQRARRFKRYKLFREHLSPKIFAVDFESHEMIWRMPIMCQTYVQQRRAISELRSARVLVSDHYFPMSKFFGQPDCENANLIGMKVLNLWVDDSADESKIPWICETLNNIIVSDK